MFPPVTFVKVDPPCEHESFAAAKEGMSALVSDTLANVDGIYSRAQGQLLSSAWTVSNSWAG